MVVVDGQKYACSTCIRGHRSTACNHQDRPLFAIRAKGRPVSQCDHCRELRKVKQVHVKCECDTKPITPAIPESEGQPVVARKGARKIKTYENQKPTFPNGFKDLAEARAILAQPESNDLISHEPSCACHEGGPCSCCTDRYVPKHARGDSSVSAGPSTANRPTHGSRPSISLTIPHPSDGPSSPGQATTPTHGRRGSRSHSRSPSRTNLHPAEGHIIGGSPNEHRQHPAHYSPYPTVNGSFNQSPSTAVANSISPSHLAPPGMDSFGYTRDSSAPPSPLSDYDRPGSAIGMNSGRNTPFDYSHIPGTPSNLPSLFGSSDMAAVDALQGMSLAGSNSSPHSVPGAGAMEQLMSTAMNQNLSPVTAFGTFRPTSQDVPSPISPSTPQFFSPTDSSTHTSPTSFVPVQQAFSNGLQSSSSADPFSGPPATSLDIDFLNSNFSRVTHQQQYPDVFESGDMDPNDNGLNGNILFGDRSRRGSHQSIASSHSGHGSYLQPHFATNSAPISATASPHIGVLGDLSDPAAQFGSLGQSDHTGLGRPTCSSATEGCTCLNMDGSLKAAGERCALDGCPCCGSRAMGSFSLFGGSGFAISTERDGGLGIGGPVGSLQIPVQVGRSRSSSQSSQISNISSASHSSLSNGMGGMNLNGMAGGASLGRANSTGQIGRNKYKNIAPRPTHHNTEPVGSRLVGVPQQQAGQVPSVIPQQQQFSFPRTTSAVTGLGPTQSSPAVIVTQHQPSEGDNIVEQLLGSLDGSSNSPQGFGNATSQYGGPSGGFSPKPMFEFSNPGAIPTGSDMRHSRNLSHPTNLQTMGVSSGSGPPSPHPRSPVLFGDPGGSRSGANSPLLPQPSSPSLQQPPPMITISHGRSQSSSNAGLLEPRPVHFSHHASGHGRSVSTSVLDGISFPGVIVTPPSPHPGALGSASGRQQ